MSLKAFHIVFVTVVTFLFVFLALWAFWYMEDRTTLSNSLGVVGILGALGMPAYGVFFYRKASRILL
jgi:hypothetical protein